MIFFVAFGLLLNFVCQSQQNKAALLVLLMHDQQAFQRLVSVIRRRRVRLNRRHIRNVHGRKLYKIVCFAKIWKPPREHIGLFEDWQKFVKPQKIGEFLKLGVALILRYLVTDLLLMRKMRSMCDPARSLQIIYQSILKPPIPPRAIPGHLTHVNLRTVGP